MNSPLSRDLVDVLDFDAENDPESPLLCLSEQVGIASASVLSTLFGQTIIPGSVFGYLILSDKVEWFFDDGAGNLVGMNRPESTTLGYVGYGNGSLVFMLGIVHKFVVYALKGKRDPNALVTEVGVQQHSGEDGVMSVITITSTSSTEEYEVTEDPLALDDTFYKVMFSHSVSDSDSAEEEGLAASAPKKTATRVQWVTSATQLLSPADGLG